MSTAESPDQATPPITFAIPYLIGLFVQLPLLLRYASDLSTRPHYGLLLIGLVATLAITLLHWPWRESRLHRATIKSVLFAVLAIATGVAGAVLGQPWFAAASAWLLLASYLSATVNHTGLHSLGYAALPLLAFVRPPLNLDLSIMTWIQRISTNVASDFMHVIGPTLGHSATDSSFVIPGQEPFVFADALIGMGSVFSLFLVAFIYVAVARRNTFQTVLLVACCVLWAIILNVAYLILLPVANLYLGMELVSGTLGYNMIRIAMLLGTALMIVSTGMFFHFAFSPVDPEIGRSYEFGRFNTAVWNSIFAGEPFINDTGQVVGRKPASITSQPPNMLLRWIAAGALLVTSILPAISFAGSLGQSNPVMNLDLSQTDLPESIDDFALVNEGYRSEEFDGTTLLGKRRDTYTYQSPDLRTKCSIGQTFNMWFELSRFYRMKGWALESRSIVDSASGDGWSYVQTTMNQESGENAVLLCGYFDAAGNPVTPPTGGNSIGGRIQAATVANKRPLVQVALVYTCFTELTEPKIGQLQQLFLKFREAAKEKILRGVESPTGETLETSAQE